MPDAVVIGSGPNGLVAANLLADTGRSVVVLEEQDLPGGAVKSAELTLPGFTHDMFSAFYPLAAASPVMASLGLEQHGLNWKHSPLVVAHPTMDGGSAVLSRDIDETARSLERYGVGDGDAWRRLSALWDRIGDQILEILLTPFPPVKAGTKMAARLGPEELMRFLRFAVLPLRRLNEEEFSGEGAGLLMAGNALHADLTPDLPAGSAFGWLLCSLGQTFGFPVAEGGAGRITDALVGRLSERGGMLRCGQSVERIEISDRRAVGVRMADGTEIPASMVLADVDAMQLYNRLIGFEHVPDRVQRDLQRFQLDNATFKIDWALDGPIPWTDEDSRRAGTLHIAESMDLLTEVTTQLTTGHIPAKPYLVVGQMNVADPSRSPAGTETAWAYTHLPQTVKGDAGGRLKGIWDEEEIEIFSERIEERIELFAPGFRDKIIGRHVISPPRFQELNRNLINGAINGGTAQIHQQLIFRPFPGSGGARTPIRNVFLASASAHPGGGVHGAPGANAVHAALGRRRQRAMTYAGLASAALLSRKLLSRR